MPVSTSPLVTLDSSLLRAIASGDPQALAKLYDRYSGMLLGLIHRIVNDPDEAEDVLQEVFLQIWDRAKFYDENYGTANTWIVIMARNKSIERLRSQKRRTGKTEKMRLHAEATQSDDGERPGLSADIKETRDRMRGCLQGLEEKQREAIELAFLGGHTQEQIAEKTAQPLGTIKARIRRGLLKLRGCLESKS
jgi:RNA polymerase sigma-70 factor, ECF subfamily